MEMENIEMEESERVIIFSKRVELLLGFCAELLPDIDLMEKAYNGASERASFALSAAPILGAMGQDYEESNFQWGLKAKRSKALVNFLKVLKETEDDRKKRKVQSLENAENMKHIRSYLGI